MAKIHAYGGSGVDVKLYRMETTPDIYWSPQRFRTEKHYTGAEMQVPAGGCNSYVIVADAERGPWKAPTGERVALLAVNGIGEVRWHVDRGMFGDEDMPGAVKHFGLVPYVRE